MKLLAVVSVLALATWIIHKDVAQWLQTRPGNSGRTSIQVSKTNDEFRFYASFPAAQKDRVYTQFDTWAAQAIHRSGEYASGLHLEFEGGRNCTLKLEQTQVMVSASQSRNSGSSLQWFNNEYSMMRNFILH